MIVLCPPDRRPVTVLIGLDKDELRDILRGQTINLDGADMVLTIGPADELRAAAAEMEQKYPRQFYDGTPDHTLR